MNGPDLEGERSSSREARGVGRELLLATADCGAKTAVHYHTSADAASRVADEAADRGASETTTVQGDVTDPRASTASSRPSSRNWTPSTFS